MALRGFIARRIIYTIILILFVIVLNWVIFQLMPGVQAGIAGLSGGVNKGTTENARLRLLAQYGLNKPVYVQFENYFWSMLTFNFGRSYNTGHPVLADALNGRLFNTLLLLGSSTVLSIVIGIALGVFVSKRRGGMFDNFWVTASLGTFALPTFFIGIILIGTFAIGLHWLPPQGAQPFNWGSNPPPLLQQIIPRLQYLLLPMITLTLVTYGGFLLLTRATMLETLGEDYVVTARAKGLKERTVLFRHALKNASLPIVTASALAFGAILGGAIITETVYSYDGLGRYLYLAILAKDFPVMQAMFYILALSTIIANFVSDLAYGMIDPRIRYE
jgi:peptide/nickel transport system permease protein